MSRCSSSSSSATLRAGGSHGTLPDVSTAFVAARATTTMTSVVSSRSSHSSRSSSNDDKNADEDDVMAVRHTPTRSADTTPHARAALNVLSATAPPSTAHSLRVSVTATLPSSSTTMSVRSASSSATTAADDAAMLPAVTTRVRASPPTYSRQPQSSPLQLLTRQAAPVAHILHLQPPPPLNSSPLQASVASATGGVCPRRLVHPHGFRVLRDDSVIERGMRGYFRLPPAPSVRLRDERARLQRTLLRLERSEQQRARARRRRHRRYAGNNDDNDDDDDGVLDGFRLLHAAARRHDADGATTTTTTAADVDPATVTAVTLRDAALTHTAPDDLAYFTRLSFLDVSENALSPEQLLPLHGLVTLHLSCNKLHSLRGLWCAVNAATAHNDNNNNNKNNDNDDDDNNDDDDDCVSARRRRPLARLRVLDVSYNRIAYADVTLLSCLPSLTRLDLSGNRLRRLPADLSSLAHVTHLLLEYNELTSSEHDDDDEKSTKKTSNRATKDNNDNDNDNNDDNNDVFASLATMPSLVEVSLSHNQLAHVPSSAMRDDDDDNNDSDALPRHPPRCRRRRFACLQVIRLVDNAFATPQSVCALAWRHRTLRHVHLAHNPLCRQRACRAATQHALDAVVRCASVRTRNRKAAAALVNNNDDDELTAMQYVTRHHVVAHFDDDDDDATTTLPRRSVRYFYATQTCAPSRRDALVTLPSDAEFMDVYCLVRGSETKTHKNSSSSDDNDRNDVTSAAAAASSCDVVEAAHAPTVADNDDGNDDDDDAHDSFFLTGMRAHGAATTTAHAAATTTTTTAACDNDSRRHDDDKDANTRADTLLPQPPLLVSSCTTNVHAAMTELRAMLRKPLPPLPFASKPRSSKRQQQQQRRRQQGATL